MVLADRNDETKIGRRSHTNSPNGHLTDEGSATDDSEHGKPPPKLAWVT